MSQRSCVRDTRPSKVGVPDSFARPRKWMSRGSRLVRGPTEKVGVVPGLQSDLPKGYRGAAGRSSKVDVPAFRGLKRGCPRVNVWRSSKVGVLELHNKGGVHICPQGPRVVNPRGPTDKVGVPGWLYAVQAKWVSRSSRPPPHPGHPTEKVGVPEFHAVGSCGDWSCGARRSSKVGVPEWLGVAGRRHTGIRLPAPRPPMPHRCE
jgi:hypothetical protein